MGMKRAMMIGLDGADPVRVKKLIAEGRMPNMKKLLEKGIATENLDMLGVLPAGTPPNWCSLATGNYPRTHGITDFLNHTLGKSLGITELNWDSRRVKSELIWEAFDDDNKKCIMLNYCEAWPNRVEGSNNIFVDGTGVVPFLRSSVAFQKMVVMKAEYPTSKEVPHSVNQASGDCVVFKDQVDKFAGTGDEAPAEGGAELYPGMGAGMSKEDLLAAMTGSHFRTPPLESPAMVLYKLSAEEQANSDATDILYTPLKDAANWGFEVPENAKECLVTMNDSLVRRYLLITASDGVHYDTFTLYPNKKADNPLGSCTLNTWSEPIYDTFPINEEPTKVAYYLRGVDMNEDGTAGRVYISHVMDIEDDEYFYPKSLQPELLKAVGPMCYFASFDRHTKLGDDIALESFDKINDWHMDATRYLFEANPDWQLFYIHLHSIDLCNHWYIEQAIPGSHPEWERMADNIDRIYEINDKYIGMVLEYVDDDTAAFVTSDHAAIPRSAGYENPGIGELSGINAGVMSELGYTTIVPVPGIEGMYAIDWSKTTAINHRTSYIYVNLKGRDPEGIVEPEDNDKTVQQIITDLYNYRDPKSGERVVSFCCTREEMELLGVGGDHVGDIFFQLTKDFGFEHFNAPGPVTNHGYSAGALCIMAGGGLRAGEVLKRPVRNVDIVPTICQLVGNRMPKDVEGGVIYQAFK